MKVLLFTFEYYPFKGGVATYTRDLASAFCDLGHSTTVLTCEYNELPHDCDDSPATVIRVNRRMSGAEIVQVIEQLHADKAFDVLLVTEREALELLAKGPRLSIPYSVTIHGTEVWWYFDRHRRRSDAGTAQQVARTLFGASNLICVSQATAGLLAAHLPEVKDQVQVVVNGVDVDRIDGRWGMSAADARSALNLSQVPLVLMVGRIHTDKGHKTAISALTHVVKQHPRATLLIAGDGPERESCESLASELSISDNVIFLGRVSDEQLALLFQACDIFLMPSRCEQRWEGFGLVFLEANLASKPVVGGAVGGVPEAIEDGVSGMLVDPASAERIAGALIDLLDDPEKRERLGSQGRERVLSRFTAERMAAETIDILARSTSQSHRRAPIDRFMRSTRFQIRTQTQRVLRKIGSRRS